MRGNCSREGKLFYRISPETFVPENHPLRPIKKMVDKALKELSPEFDKMYADCGRPSIPPEHLLKAMLLQVFYSIRSNRMLAEQITYNFLFRWFIGLGLDEEVWDHSSFSTNRERLLKTDIAGSFFAKIKEQADKAGLLSDEHFTVDGTLIEAWASIKSFKPKGDCGGEPPQAPQPQGRNDAADFHGEKFSNETHASTTDPDARLIKKSQGKEAKLSHMGHILMENRNGLVVEAVVTIATGTAERDAAVAMVSERESKKRITLGADKNYDTRDCVQKLREAKVTPHVAQNNKSRRSAVDGRTTRHSGYHVSQRIRKRVEEVFGWMKTVGGMRKTLYTGTEKVGLQFTIAAAAYNLVRMKNLNVYAT